jgi:hypothetical protein
MDTRRGRKRRGHYRLLELGISALAAGLLGASSCTVFSGLTVPDETGSSTSGTTSGIDPTASGSGGSGSSSGGGGSAPSGSVTFLSMGEAQNACTLAFTCPLLAKSIALSIGVPVDDTNYSQCLTWLAAPVPSRVGAAAQLPLLQCVGGALDCDAAAACLPVEALEPNDALCTSGSTCLGPEKALDCDADVIYHCETTGFASGSACVESDSQVACVTESCSDPGSATCEGDTLVSCKEPGIVRTPCSVAGLACSDPPGGAPAACVGEGPCTAPGAASCQGNLVLACGDGVLSAFDCGNVDGQCASDIPDKARCDPPGASCKPSDADVNTCNANKKKINICVGGAKMQVSCQSGTQCLGATGGQTAYCG